MVKWDASTYSKPPSISFFFLNQESHQTDFFLKHALS